MQFLYLFSCLLTTGDVKKSDLPETKKENLLDIFQLKLQYSKNTWQKQLKYNIIIHDETSKGSKQVLTKLI